MAIIVCSIPAGTMAREFDPFPGSEKAIRLGCTCPDQPLWPEKLRFEASCSVHELESVPNG